jgi:hypothetical protein
MPAAYSYDLRERVVDAVERGSSRRRRLQGERGDGGPVDKTPGGDGQFRGISNGR